MPWLTAMMVAVGTGGGAPAPTLCYQSAALDAGAAIGVPVRFLLLSRVGIVLCCKQPAYGAEQLGHGDDAHNVDGGRHMGHRLASWPACRRFRLPGSDGPGW